MAHIPVFLNEVIGYLNSQPGGKFIDATINGGGHATAILEKIKPDGKLLGIEWDPGLAKNLKAKFKELNFINATVINESYVNLKKIGEENGFREANGILFDLGLSSLHYEAGRGFTFQRDEPLDMRYNPENISLAPAIEIVNKYGEKEIARILKEYGEEKFAKSIAAAIVKTRTAGTIRSTFQLVEIIKGAIPFRYRTGKIHFATRTFQALRIAVNRELENLQAGLNQAGELLASGGRLAVISFHSLEDRIVKIFFSAESKKGDFKIITKKPVRAGLAEIERNPRARSAKLRVAEKI